jgi:hypothetical protein
MIDRFEELLRELGVEYSLPLHPDKHGFCKLRINETLSAQIEFNPDQNIITIATFISEIPAGKFRENILKAALQNNHYYPEKSHLSYCDKNNQLALFQKVSITTLTGKKLSEILSEFINKAEEWRTAIGTGNLTGLTPKARIESKGMFGLTP